MPIDWFHWCINCNIQFGALHDQWQSGSKCAMNRIYAAVTFLNKWKHDVLKSWTMSQ